jgi:hypothetical protein
MIPVGTHVEVRGLGGTWFGQIVSVEPGRRYVVRVGGTDVTRVVPETQIALHPSVRASIERAKDLTPRMANIALSAPELNTAASGIRMRREGLRKVIGQAAYMTGDMIGILAALTFDPDLCVDILVDTKYYVEEYRAAAKVMHKSLTLLEFYCIKHPRDAIHSEEEVVFKLAARMPAQAKMIATTYQLAGVSIDRIRIHDVPDARKRYKEYELAYVRQLEAGRGAEGGPRPAWYATQRVGEAFRNSTPTARAQLAGAMFFNISPEVAQGIEDFCHRTFRRGQQLLLMWGRRSGQNPGGAHPELDTNKYAVIQILDLLIQENPHRQVVVIGDALYGSKGTAGAHAYINLADFWDKVIPKHRLDRLAQLYFLAVLNRHCNVIAIGMRSGVLEGPALLGMRTLFLEDLACHPQFGENVGDRMEMWSGGGPQDLDRSNMFSAGPLDPAPAVSNYRRVQTTLRLGQITEILATLESIRFFWSSHPPPSEGKPKSIPADATIRQIVKAIVAEAKMILEQNGRVKHVRFVDSGTLRTRVNPAMLSLIGVDKKKTDGFGDLQPKNRASRPRVSRPIDPSDPRVSGWYAEYNGSSSSSSATLRPLSQVITSLAGSLRTILSQYMMANACNLPNEERSVLYKELKACLKAMVQLSPQDLNLIAESIRRLERL